MSTSLAVHDGALRRDWERHSWKRDRQRKEIVALHDRKLAHQDASAPACRCNSSEFAEVKLLAPRVILRCMLAAERRSMREPLRSERWEAGCLRAYSSLQM